MVWIRNHFSPYISKRHTISIYDVYSLSSLEVRYDTIHKLFDASLNTRWSRHSKFAIHTYMWFNYRVEWNKSHLWFCNIIWCIWRHCISSFCLDIAINGSRIFYSGIRLSLYVHSSKPLWNILTAEVINIWWKWIYVSKATLHEIISSIHNE